MPHGYLKHAPKGDVSAKAMRGGSSGKSSGASSSRKRMKAAHLGGLLQAKAGSRGHGGKGRSRHELNAAAYDGGDIDRARWAGQPRTQRVASAGSRVSFEAAPGVVLGATVSSVNSTTADVQDYTIEIFDGVTIPGVSREQLSFSPVAPAPASGIGSATAAQSEQGREQEAGEDFVLVGAPLPRAESVGAPVPRLESDDDDDEGLASLTSLQSIDDLASLDAAVDAVQPKPFEMSWATKLSYKGPGSTPRPPPSFQSVQAEEQQAKASPKSELEASETRPNARVVQGCVLMGFESEVSAQASLATGNESIEAAARWLVDNLEEHERARKATEHPKAEQPPMPEQPKAVGFVDKVTEALRPSTPEAEGEEEDGEWDIVDDEVEEESNEW